MFSFSLTGIYKATAKMLPPPVLGGPGRGQGTQGARAGAAEARGGRGGMSEIAVNNSLMPRLVVPELFRHYPLLALSFVLVLY